VTEWLNWARGPAFRFSFVLFVLGFLRLGIVNLANIFGVWSRTRSRKVPWSGIIRETATWLFPYRRTRSHRFVTLISFLFHIAIIVTPIFLAAHVSLWLRGTGIGWITLPQVYADYLTLVAIATSVALFVTRVSSNLARTLSRPQDYLILLLILFPFVSGYLAMHPGINPFNYNATMFVHVMSGNLILVLIPFSKVSHVVLFPTTQLVSEMAWHLAPGAGDKVALALGKENEPI
jgi:nitrate reductase gamma subunit